LAEPQRHPFFDNHADDHARPEPPGVADDIKPVAELAEHRTDGNDENCSLRESDGARRELAPAHHKQHAQGVECHIG